MYFHKNFTWTRDTLFAVFLWKSLKLCILKLKVVKGTFDPKMCNSYKVGRNFKNSCVVLLKMAQIMQFIVHYNGILQVRRVEEHFKPKIEIQIENKKKHLIKRTKTNLPVFITSSILPRLLGRVFFKKRKKKQNEVYCFVVYFCIEFGSFHNSQHSVSVRSTSQHFCAHNHSIRKIELILHTPLAYIYTNWYEIVKYHRWLFIL